MLIPQFIRSTCVKFDDTCQEYEPDPRPHLAVFTHSVEFAQEQICLFHDSDDLQSQDHHAWNRKRNDPMAGTRVLVVNSSRFRGYQGTIQYTHKPLKFFGVRLDVTGRIIHLSENLLVDAS